jgi:hypothetical protein
VRGDTVVAAGTVTAVYVKKNADGSMKSDEIPEQIVSRLREAIGIRIT